ncbi:MAG: hypothetical protein ACKO4T_04540 [Planctomycetaceae bacterium]
MRGVAAVVQSRTQIVWALAACAAVSAQVTPRALCQACDQPCCASRANGHAPRAAAAPDETTGGCPLCAAESGCPLTDASDRPCHCQLKARHSEPLAHSRSTLPSLADGALTTGLPALPRVALQVLGVSREYLAASLAIPIRPPRILFGVWRN